MVEKCTQSYLDNELFDISGPQVSKQLLVQI